jgi:hypothetical protein
MFMQLAMGRWVSQGIAAAATLGIADLLADGPLSAEELATKTGTLPETLYRLLRALSSVGVFTETAPGTFASTPIGDVLRSAAPNSMRNMAMMLNDPWQLYNWSHLVDCLRSGKAAMAGEREDLFSYFTEHPEELQTFQAAMSDMSRGASRGVLSAYDFSGIHVLADIAGGHGLLLTDVLRANPHLKGILFERAEVIEGARSGPYIAGLESRVTLASGDFFESVAAGADAYMMKHILHDWMDVDALRILKNIRAVIPSGGRLLLVESVVPAGNEPHPAKWIDIEMLVSPGGKERTSGEWTTLLAEGGFRLSRIIPTPSLFCVIEASPA